MDQSKLEFTLCVPPALCAYCTTQLPRHTAGTCTKPDEAARRTARSQIAL